MDHLIKTTFILAFGSAMALVGASCTPEAVDHPGQAGTAEAVECSDGEDAVDDCGAGDVAGEDNLAPELSPQYLPAGQDIIRATNQKTWRAIRNCNNPDIQLRPRRLCYNAPTRAGWIFEKVGAFTLIRSASCNKCLTLKALHEPVDLETCTGSAQQLFKIVPPPNGNDRICWTPSLCITFVVNKLYPTDFVSAPTWYRDSC